MVSLAFFLKLKKRYNNKKPHSLKKGWSFTGILTSSWKPWQAGLAIGLIAAPAYLSSVYSGRNYPLGISHGVLQVEQILTDNNHKNIWRIEPARTQELNTEKPLSTGPQATSPTLEKPQQQ